MSTPNTPKLDLLRIQDTWQFGDEAFNRFIDDADNKLVGVSHLSSKVHWQLWESGHAYVTNDVVRWENMKTHQYAKCISSGNSSSTMPTNNVTGSIVTDGGVTWQVVSLSETDAYSGTIKIWLSGQYYTRGDAVRYGSSLYRCTVSHEADSWTNDYMYWQEIFASIRLWQNNIYYFENDSVIYNNLIYKCNTAHVSAATFTPSEESNWDLVADTGGAKEWQTEVEYRQDQLVTYKGILYKSNNKHTSAADFETDIANWNMVFTSISQWQTDTYYPLNIIIYYNNTLYRCINAHTSGLTTIYDDGSYWTLFHNIISTWAADTYYFAGQIVTYNNALYRCNLAHTSSSTFDITKWDLLLNVATTAQVNALFI